MIGISEDYDEDDEDTQDSIWEMIEGNIIEEE